MVNEGVAMYKSNIKICHQLTCIPVIMKHMTIIISLVTIDMKAHVW